MLRSRPGPQATETMGSGRGKGRVTPVFTCPGSTRAPDNPPPSRRLARLREHPSFGGGVGGGGCRRPPSPRCGRAGGLLPGPRAALSDTPWRSPKPPLLESRCPRVEPGIPGLRVRCIPRSAACPGLQRAAPPPPRRRGATAHVSPPAQSRLSLRLREPEDPERVGPGRGKGPGRIHFPLPKKGGGRRRAAAPSPASRFLERRAEITPSPLGLTWGRGRGLVVVVPPPLPNSKAAFQNLAPQTKFRDPNPARGQLLLASRVERAQAAPPVRSLRGEGEGTLGSPPGHSLLKPTPFGSLARGEATTPHRSLPPCWSFGGDLEPGRGLPPHPTPRTLECCHPAAGLGASQLSSSGNPETRFAAGPSFPGAVPPVFSASWSRAIRVPPDLDPGGQGSPVGVWRGRQ